VSIARRLWADNADVAEAALAHPFVRGLADGTLPRDRYSGYLAQDAFFLQAFARGYAMAVVRSPDRPALEAFADLLAGVRAELRLHDAVAAREGIDLSAVEPAPATSAYTDFLLATAATGGLGEICAAMTPCMRLYAFLGRSLAGRSAASYAEWVTAYADPDFETLAATLEELLDRYADGGAVVARAYRRAMELELAFFASAWAGGRGLLPSAPTRGAREPG
jgi:thiaminase/transcriptional activator TenA